MLDNDGHCRCLRLVERRGKCLQLLSDSLFLGKTIEGGKCQDKMALWFSIAALNITTDLAIFALPMPVFASLQLPRKQKMCLMLVFAVGGL